MSAFTPGPWHRNIKPAAKYPTIFAGRNTHVAVVQSRGLTDAETEANCDLIATAPELFAALEAGPSVEHVLPDAVRCNCSQCEFVRLRRAAIAKATGSTP